jgi:hypothetical protein
MLLYDTELWVFIVKAIYECESDVEVQRNYWRHFNVHDDLSVCCTMKPDRLVIKLIGRFDFVSMWGTYGDSHSP